MNTRTDGVGRVAENAVPTRADGNAEMAPQGADPALRAFCVLRDRVPASALDRAALRFGPAPKAGGDRGVAATLLATVDRDRVSRAFGESRFLTAELPDSEADDGPLDGDWLGAPPVDQGFYLSLTTASAYGLPCAVLMCDELMRRGVVTKERRGNIELCLHEAVANALVHGNLGIPSSVKAPPDGYRLFSRLLAERLGDPALRKRRLDLFAWWDAESVSVAVADQGGGFDTAILPVETSGGAHSGRGFIFMRTLARRVDVTDGGRCTALLFDR